MTHANAHPQVTFADLVETMRRLRDPNGGCPWDLEQTHASLRDTLLEETYEALEALASGEPSELVEELGDLLLQVLFHAQIGKDEGRFTLDDIVAHLNEKLVRRHPHVFGDQAASTAAEAIGQWEKLKAAERSAKGQGERSMLAGVPKTMPALAYAQAVQERAARAGFDWDAPEAVLDKVAEELAELRREESPRREEEEFGDLLFAMVGAAHRMGVEAEVALRGANARFAERFAGMEAALYRRGTTFAELEEKEKLALWEQAKTQERG